MNTAPLKAGPRTGTKPVEVTTSLAYLVGAGLIIWSAYIHFHLWDSVGYRHIPTIGPLFLLQSIGGLIVGLLVLAFRQVWIAVAGIGFAASTMVGFLLTVGLKGGLFGFKESWSASFAHEAFAIEIATMVVLLIAGALSLTGSASSTRAGSTPSVAPMTGA
jgi:hypothetical protein